MRDNIVHKAKRMNLYCNLSDNVSRKGKNTDEIKF